jgi:hypothetical protein
VSEIPAHDTQHPPNRHHPESQAASFARTRLCILCGHPVRAGQRLLRIHGSMIHARCSTSRYEHAEGKHAEVLAR